MKNSTVFGVDLAKNVFQVCAVNRSGKCISNKKLTREKFKEFIIRQQPCTIAMEACGSAHYWARLCMEHGHDARLIAPKFVKPYVKSNKNDRNDAVAIAEACTRPDMRFVAVKTVEQQDMLSIHRARDLAIKQRTAQANQIRGLLYEQGIIIPQGISHIRTKLIEILDKNQDTLSKILSGLIKDLYETFKIFDASAKQYDRQIEVIANQDKVCREIQKIPGVGPIVASAITATVGNAGIFKNGREMSAWLGIVPRQHSSGGKDRLGGISKRGDRYVRKMLVQGARSVVLVCDKKDDRLSCWTQSKRLSAGFNKAAVALANKNARMIWAIMAKDESYRQPA